MNDMIEKQKELIKSLNRQLEKEEYKLYAMLNHLDNKPQTIGDKDQQHVMAMPKVEKW